MKDFKLIHSALAPGGVEPSREVKNAWLRMLHLAKIGVKSKAMKRLARVKKIC